MDVKDIGYGDLFFTLSGLRQKMTAGQMHWFVEWLITRQIIL
jgi:hypothetical protein